MQREPDGAAINALLDEVFSKAWPERVQRLSVSPGHRTEQREDGVWIHVAPGMSAMVFYGPYTPLRAGRYRVSFEFRWESDVQCSCVRCEVTRGVNAEVVGFQDVGPVATRATLDFTLAELAFCCQFRCISLGRAGFSVRRGVELAMVSSETS